MHLLRSGNPLTHLRLPSFQPSSKVIPGLHKSQGKKEIVEESREREGKAGFIFSLLRNRMRKQNKNPEGCIAQTKEKGSKKYNNKSHRLIGKLEKENRTWPPDIFLNLQRWQPLKGTYYQYYWSAPCSFTLFPSHRLWEASRLYKAWHYHWWLRRKNEIISISQAIRLVSVSRMEFPPAKSHHNSTSKKREFGMKIIRAKETVNIYLKVVFVTVSCLIN